MKLKEVMPSIDFADSELKSLYLQDDSVLIVDHLSWKEKIIRISFEGLHHFSYKTGSFTSNFYEVLFDLPSLSHNEMLKKHADATQEFRIFQIIDIDDLPFIEVAARTVNVFEVS